MGGIGVPELVLILVIVIIIFGATRLPQIGDALGKSIRNFKKGAIEDDAIDVTPKRENLQEPPLESNSSGDVQRPSEKVHSDSSTPDDTE